MRRVLWSNGKLYAGLNSFDWTLQLVAPIPNGNGVFKISQTGIALTRGQATSLA